MKLRNRETDVVVDCEIIDAFYDNIVKIKLIDKATGSVIAMYTSRTELYENWKDYEEPKGIIGICQALPACPSVVHIEMATEKEAEKAVEKLKAWKRLKDKGFKFTGFYGGSKCIDFEYDDTSNAEWIKENRADLDLLFGGEE